MIIRFWGSELLNIFGGFAYVPRYGLFAVSGSQWRLPIEHFEITDHDIRAIFKGIMPGKYVRLSRRGSVVMSDTMMEKRTNREFCGKAHGDVLVGGLGIGMILMAIQDNPAVNSITVLEKYQEVIDMVAQQLPLNEKVKIICADVFEWKPENGQRFDCIYMDIWDYINSEIYRNEMKPLKRKYGHYLKSIQESPKRFNTCWAEWYAKNNRELC